jgi:hypothetical protein
VIISSGPRVIRVPFYNLSLPDREYVREQLTARGESAQLPPEIPDNRQADAVQPAPLPLAPEPTAAPPVGRGSGANGQEHEQARRDQRSSENSTSGEDRSRQSMQARDEAHRGTPVGYCTKCKNPITIEERKLNKCPHCGSLWQFEINRFGHKRAIPGAATAADGDEVALELTALSNRGLSFKEPRNIIAFGIGLPIIAAISSVITALVLRAAAYLVCGEHLPYGDAYGTMFFSYLANGVIGFVYTLIMQSMEQPTDGSNPLSFLMLPIGFLVQSGIISARHEMDFGPACLISLAIGLIFFAIILVIVIACLTLGVVPLKT